MPASTKGNWELFFNEEILLYDRENDLITPLGHLTADEAVIVRDALNTRIKVVPNRPLSKKS